MKIDSESATSVDQLTYKEKMNFMRILGRKLSEYTTNEEANKDIFDFLNCCASRDRDSRHKLQRVTWKINKGTPVCRRRRKDKKVKMDQEKEMHNEKYRTDLETVEENEKDPSVNEEGNNYLVG